MVGSKLRSWQNLQISQGSRKKCKEMSVLVWEVHSRQKCQEITVQWEARFALKAQQVTSPRSSSSQTKACVGSTYLKHVAIPRH